MLDHEVHSKLIDFTTKNYNNVESTSEVINYIGRNIKYLNCSDCEPLNKIHQYIYSSQDINQDNNLEAIKSYINFIIHKYKDEPFWMYYLRDHYGPDDKKKFEKIVELVGSAKDLHKELSSMYKNDYYDLENLTTQLIKLSCFLPEDKKNMIVNILKCFEELPRDPINLKQIVI